jgi:hypothetical protein
MAYSSRTRQTAAPARVHTQKYYASSATKCREQINRPFVAVPPAVERESRICVVGMSIEVPNSRWLQLITVILGGRSCPHRNAQLTSCILHSEFHILRISSPEMKPSFPAASIVEPHRFTILLTTHGGFLRVLESAYERSP